MNTFYYFENEIYETESEVQNATRNFTRKRYDKITTDKCFKEFYSSYIDSREQGNSCGDAIEWAK